MSRALAIGILVALACIACGRPSPRAADLPNCALSSGPCVARPAGSGVRVTLEATPRPVRSMAELGFKVTIEGIHPAPPSLTLDFTMPGMYMGINRVALAPGPGGSYEGKGVLPRCPSGRRVWRARVLESEPGGIEPREYASFTFEALER